MPGKRAKDMTKQELKDGIMREAIHQGTGKPKGKYASMLKEYAKR